MTRQEYIKALFNDYSLVSKLSNKNDCEVLRLRNKKYNADLILRSYPICYSAYEELYKIECENLPLIYDVINLDDGQIVLEEYINGITVAEVLQNGNYHYLGARKVLKGVCTALDLLHSKKLVHRDVKPENIIIDKSGRVVLIDFNASRKISNKTKDTIVMGTVGYASPEQLGLSQSDSRTDIYATGVLFNVMLTGKHPTIFLAKGKAGKIIKKCTNLNPNDRFQTAMNLYKTL